MKAILHFDPLTSANFNTYIEVGTKAYNQHYPHLWPNGDTTPYIHNSFTLKVLKEEEKNRNTQLFLIQLNTACVGILKFTLDCSLAEYSSKAALYLDKIYITKEATGFGIGTKTLHFVTLRAKALNKSILWLEAMQKGPALGFYKKNGFSVHSTSQIPFEQAIASEKLMFIMKKDIS